MLETPADVSRRDFLKAGSLAVGAAGTTFQTASALPTLSRSAACILLHLVGGPSHLDTFDPKPNAPAEVRGPFGSIASAVPGVRLSEHLPRTAARLDRVSLVRSVFHDADPIHEAGQQLVQTGHLGRGGRDWPHVGSLASARLGPARPGVPAAVLLPGPVENTGVSVSHGQGAAWLGTDHEPAVISVGEEVGRERYGPSAFGDACLRACRLVEAGARVVTVNMFETVFDRITWDCHADGGSLPATLADYASTLCPMFDRAFAALLDDLAERGLLDSTLVLATGEFGRTPRINPRGGRDHWPGCWTALLAGGGVRGGQIVGASDARGARPADRPVAAAELAATVLYTLGIDPSTRAPGPDGRPVPLVDVPPIHELFA